MAFVSGVLASVSVGAASFAFSKWAFDMKIGLPKVTNFTSAGFRTMVAGVTEGSISVSGPYDSGADAWAVGTEYDVVLSWDGNIDLSMTGFLESIKASQDVEDAGRLELVFQSNGVYTAEVA